MKIIDWNTLSAGQQQEVLTRPAVEARGDIARQVEAIIDRVRREGDAALTALAQELDGALLSELAVTEDEIEAAEAALSAQQKSAISTAIQNVERFHAAQKREPIVVETTPGVVCERLVRPLERVGLYVPAGSAPLPSTVIMLSVPARIAGCPLKVLCSPPRSDSTIDPAVLVAARLCDIDVVFKAGGAQAIAALAYGTQSVPKVDKIFGPGNAWVTAAKQQVSQDPGGAAIDMPAGPSEVLVIADRKARADFVASDLLSQAEHGPDSQVMLVTTSREMATQALKQVRIQTAALSRADTVAVALAKSAIIVTRDMSQAIEISNRYAPEHLILQVDMPRQWLRDVRHAGSVFIGPWAPESIGDYCSGTNHVLPTYGFARNHSGLGLSDFQKSITVQELTEEGLKAIGPAAQTLAELEGLDAHGRAVTLRLDSLRKHGAA